MERHWLPHPQRKLGDPADKNLAGQVAEIQALHGTLRLGLHEWELQTQRGGPGRPAPVPAGLGFIPALAFLTVKGA